MEEKMNKNDIRLWMQENLLTKREAMKITGQTLTAFDQAVMTGRLKPFFSRGKGRGIVRLYLKEDVEEYNKERLSTLEKFNRK